MREALVCLFITALAAPVARGAEPSVELFSPLGTVKGVRQVTARFSTPMVAFGDPRLPQPFEIACPERGSGRWGVNVACPSSTGPRAIRCAFRDAVKPLGFEVRAGFHTGECAFRPPGAIHRLGV